MHRFSIFATISVATNFVVLTTFFLAAFVLNERRIAARRVDCCCCIVSAKAAAADAVEASAAGAHPEGGFHMHAACLTSICHRCALLESLAISLAHPK